MKNLKLTLIALLVSVSTFAQIDTPAPSPSAKLTQEVGLTTVTIDYSRPSMKGRAIFGGLLKYDELWRTGANLATKITFSDAVTFAGNKLAGGDYVILTVPTSSDWTVNIYAFEGAGVGPYFSKEPIATGTVPSTKLNDAVETFTIDVNNIGNNTATIDLVWEKTKVSIPLDVDADSKVMAQIDAYDTSAKNKMANDFNGAAGYLLAEKKNLEKALELSTKATAIRPDAFWMMRTKSLIEAELGQYKKAIASAELSLAAAEKAENSTYINFNKASIAEWKKKK